MLRPPSSLSERKWDALLMAGFLPKSGNYALISANFVAKAGPLSNEWCSLRQAASNAGGHHSLLGLLLTLQGWLATVAQVQARSGSAALGRRGLPSLSI